MSDIEPYIGGIALFGFSFNPRGYMMCNGQILSIAQYNALYALLGTTYGGNGVQTFALPDLRSRAPVHVGTGTGLSNYALGQSAGQQSITLLQTNLPQHVHTFTNQSTLNAVDTPATAPQPGVGSLLATGTDKGGTDTPRIYVPSGTAGTQVALGGLNVAGTVGIAGGSQPVGILRPYLALNYCIAVEGIFPSRN